MTDKEKLVWKRILFYLVSFTWGAIMSIIGLIIIGVSAIFGRVHSYHGRLYAVIGKNWGGLELGCFFLIGENCEECCAHECGHGLQNCIWGPLFPFVIWIPSAFRYWYRKIVRRKNYYLGAKLPPYDSIWFEGQATKWGETYIDTDIL